MNNFKPILFSTPMVQAILRGEKTQTRRIIKPQPVIDMDSGYKFWDHLMFDIHDDLFETLYLLEHAKYSVGDILWVRETWQQRNDKAIQMGFDKYYYKAGWEGCTDAGWKPSIFMPKEACRIFLKVTNIRAEMLNNICENDAIKEGIIELAQSGVQLAVNGKLYFDYSKKKKLFNDGLTAKDSYKSLWEKINGKNSWDENPFIWVYEFERTDVSFSCS